MNRFLFPIALCLTMPLQASAENAAEGFLAFENGDFDLALNELRPFAENGNVRAQSILGFIYYVVEYPPNYSEALKWNRLSASQGDQSAQFLLALAYTEGFGVEVSYRAAHVWFNIAAMYGDVQAASRRDDLESLMTTYQRSKALADALICVKSEFEFCP